MTSFSIDSAVGVTRGGRQALVPLPIALGKLWAGSGGLRGVILHLPNA
ncbi:hypothetical protein [Halomonas sp. DQ26W]|nr:hypothetical protein [Halomonas sp. DQ26W]